MNKCGTCEYAVFDCEEYYGTTTKHWHVSGCKLDLDTTKENEDCESYSEFAKELAKLPSVLPELPSYVAEIEEEYQKAVKSPYIHKPLAKALYEVWKKHDREDAERRADED